MDAFINGFLRESNAIENVWDDESLKQAWKAWRYLAKQKELTTENLLKTHAILMIGKLDYDEIGAWRKAPVWIGGREATPWYAVPDLMNQWIKHVNSCGKVAKQDKNNADELVRQDHVWFEFIHPFIDGNGRVGRMIMNWQRLKAGLSLLILFEKEKQEYYKWFERKESNERKRS